MHITKVAYSDSLERVADAPVIDPSPPGAGGKDAPLIAPRHLGAKYVKGGVSLLILAMAASSKAKSQWGHFSVKPWLTDSARCVSKFAIDNVVMVGVSVGNGFADGLSESLWFERPWWFPWSVRLVRYAILVYQFGLGPLLVNSLS